MLDDLLGSQMCGSRLSKEQGRFRKGWGCVYMIFSLRMLVEKMLRKGNKVSAAFMDLQKAYDIIIDWIAMWDLLKVYCVGGSFLNGTKAFFIKRLRHIWIEKWVKALEYNG